MTAFTFAMMLLALPQAIPVPPAAAPDAKTIVSRYRSMTSVAPTGPDHCGSGGQDDITVCGNRHSDQRLPLPDERAPPNGPRLPGAGNERAQAMCEADTGRPCLVCPPTGCVGVNLLAVPFKLFRIVRAVVDPDR